MSNTENPTYYSHEWRWREIVRSPEDIRSENASKLHDLEITQLSEDISKSLKWKFDSINLPFNIGAFESTLKTTLDKVMGNPDIPFIAKRKFFEDVRGKIDLLSNITPGHITALRNQRMAMSFWTESIELSGKSEKEIQAHYLQMILMETIGNYITPVAIWLLEAFDAEKLLEKDGEFFHKETLKKTEQYLQKLDQKYWFSFSPDASRFLRNPNNNARTEFLKLIQKGILSKHPNGLQIEQMIKNAPSSVLTDKNSSLRKGADIDFWWKKINIIDAYREYTTVISSWQAIEREVRTTRAIALADWVISKMKNWLGMEQLKSEFDYLEWDDLANKMKNASIADTIILITQFATIAPVIWDIWWWTLDVVGTATGVSVDGAMMSTAERAISGVFGGLGILVVGGWLNRARKAWKLAKVGKALSEALKSLPNKIEATVKSGVVIPEKALVLFKDIAKRLWGEAGRRIEIIVERLKSWTQQKLQAKFPNTTRVLSWEQSRRIPKIKPEELNVDKYALSQDAKDAIKKIVLEWNIKTPIARIEANIRGLNMMSTRPFLNSDIESVIRVLEKHKELDLPTILKDYEVQSIQFEYFLKLLLIQDKSTPYTDLLKYILAWNHYFYNWILRLETIDERLRYIQGWNRAEVYLQRNLRNFSIFFWDAWVDPGLILAKKFQESWIDLSLVDRISEQIPMLQYKEWGFDMIYYTRKQFIDDILKWDSVSITKDIIETSLKGVLEKIREFWKTDSVNGSTVQVPTASAWDNITEASTPLFDRYQELLGMPVEFNPKEWLDYIRRLIGEQRIIAMKVWKQRLKEQLDIIADIPTKVKNLSETIDFSRLPKEEIMQWIIGKLQHMFEHLSVEQRKEILLGIEKYVDRKMIVHKYAENPLYKDNPKKLIADAYWIDVWKLKWEVTAEIDGANFTFYVHREDDYKLIYAFWDEEVAKNSPSSGWFASSRSKIPELKWTISVVNWPNDGNIYRKWTKVHETRHMDNQILMPDHSLRVSDSLSYAKDEIIAFLNDAKRNIEEIKMVLLKKWDTALYDYYKDMEKSNPDIYKGVRRLYEHELITAIDIAHKMLKANIPNYLDILAITPVRQWSHLEWIYLSPHLSQQEKILKNIQMIFEKTGELHSAINADLISIFWKDKMQLAQIFCLTLISTVVVQYILEKHYPEWDDDLKNNADVFFSKIREFLNPETIQKYFRDFLK